MPEDKRNKKNIGIFVFYIVLIILIYVAISNNFKSQNIQEIEYSDFMNLLTKNEIVSMEIEDTGTVTMKISDGTTKSMYAPTLLMDQQFLNSIALDGVKLKIVKALSSSWWISLIGYLVPIVFFIFLWWVMLKPMTGRNSQGMNFTKSPAKKFVNEKGKITFKDVAGIDEAEEELEDIVKFLKNPKEFNDLGARMPKGVLLVGSPGTGKTLVARAVAGEADVPFFYISGSDFVELFVGVGAARVRDLFTQAKQSSPAIIFIDEIDAVGRQRGAGLGGGHDEREQTLNQMLVEMDGFDPKAGIIVMAATNRPDILDKALLRPGRFDKKIIIDSPDLNGREAILKVHMRGKKISKDVEPKILAQRTPGFVGADLENIINEAALLAARNKRAFINMLDCEEAIERIIAGPTRKSRLVSPKEKKIIAYHELGHAFLGTLLPHSDPVHKVTIVPRGHQALGYTLQVPTEDKFLMSKSELCDRIVGVLGGRAAEEIVFNEITSGAGNDLKKATEYARLMVCQLGMSEKVGPIAWGEEEGEVFLGRQLSKMKNYSQETAREIDSEIKSFIVDGYNKAKDILRENREKLDVIAKYLLKVETISGDDLKKMIEKPLDELDDYLYGLQDEDKGEVNNGGNSKEVVTE